jgi:hypothetical protein
VQLLFRLLIVQLNGIFSFHEFAVAHSQRHLLELRLPRQKRDAPVSFIGLVISTIKMLSGRDVLHLVNKH